MYSICAWLYMGTAIHMNLGVRQHTPEENKQGAERTRQIFIAHIGRGSYKCLVRQAVGLGIPELCEARIRLQEAE